MKQEMDLNEENFVEYGGIKFELGALKDLSGDELASPEELERQVIKAELEPLLLLPRSGKGYRNFSAHDCSDEIGFDAFGTVDFDKYRPKFDSARYKADKLKAELKRLVIQIEMLNDRIHDKNKYKLLKCVKLGIIDKDDIENWDMWQIAVYYMRAIKLRKQIAELAEASRIRKERKYQRWLDSLG